MPPSSASQKLVVFIRILTKMMPTRPVLYPTDISNPPTAITKVKPSVMMVSADICLSRSITFFSVKNPFAETEKNTNTRMATITVP